MWVAVQIGVEYGAGFYDSAQGSIPWLRLNDK
jgi:hypothetical protein